MASVLQPSFAKGEIGPSLYARVDTAMYAVALRTARNAIIHEYGGVSNRPGTEFVCPCGQHDNPPKLIDFQFNTSDTYTLEFGNQYMRVVRNGAQVVEDPVTITGATQANPVEITANSHGYSNGDDVYISGVGGMTELNGRWFTVSNAATNTFDLTDQVTGANIDGTGYTAYTSGGEVEKVYQITTPYLQADLADLKYVQSADTMTLVHRDYAPRELTRTDHDAWTLAEISFGSSLDAPTGITHSVVGTTGSTEYKYKVTVYDPDTGNESLSGIDGTTITITNITNAAKPQVTAASHGLDDGDEVYISGVSGMTEINGQRSKITVVAGNIFSLDDIDTTNYSTYTSGGTAAETFARVTNGNATLSTSNFITLNKGTADISTRRYYRWTDGDPNYGYVGLNFGPGFSDQGTVADFDRPPPEYRNPFQGSGTYPGAVSYYEQRRVFANSTNKPDTVWFSEVGNQSSFNVSDPSVDSDAITATLNARQVNEIRHLVPLSDLLALTSGSEWKFNAGSDSGFAAATLRRKPQSYWGSADVQPIVIGSEILFVVSRATKVRSLGYALETDGYTGNNLTLLAPHIFESETLTDWAYAQIPNSAVHCVRSDGVAPVLTYNREQDVVAWSRWDTDGEFESVCTIPESADNEDAVYYVVKRTINGNTVRYIERLHTRYFATEDDAFFVDCGLTYSGSAATTISGLDHLEGESVVALADGDVVTGLTVSGGAITLATAASTVHIGLAYTCDIETLNVEDSRSTVQGKLKKISKVTLRLKDSRDFTIGPDSSRLSDQRITSLFSGDIEKAIPATWNVNGRIFIRQADPTPLTVLAVIPDVTVGG